MFFLVSPSQIQLGPGPMRKPMGCFSEIQLSHHMASRSPGLAHDLALEGHGHGGLDSLHPPRWMAPGWACWVGKGGNSTDTSLAET